ncbi:MAG TPA: sugar phosphate isomerase/epimerase [Planctomycetota bacterium]|jgi:sugar phosphate isomerase/epimerase
MNNGCTRRGFLKTAAVAGTLAGLSKGILAADAKKIGISVQLYSVRNECGKDMDAALEQIAKMGFAGVEFAGYAKYGGKAKELRKRLDDLKLTATGTHIGTGSLKGDALKGTIEFHQTIGCKYLIVPGDGAFGDPIKSKDFAETFNKAMETLKPLGMACGYHNHTEIAKIDPETKKTYWELFAERTTPDVVLQQDCGWTAAAGLNPAEMVKKHPGRTKIPHFKPTVVGKAAGKKAFFGEDSVDWKSVIEACYSVGGTEWFVIEQEAYPDGKSPMECTAISLAGLKKMLTEMGKA